MHYLMQLVLEQGSIDNPLNFDVALIQLDFHTSAFSPDTCKGIFNPNFITFQISQEGCILVCVLFSSFYSTSRALLKYLNISFLAA